MLALLTPLAVAGAVYVNGVDVGDMRSQTFENATVVFDSQGNIHISAPGYQIQVVGAPPAPAPPSPAPAAGTAPDAGAAPGPAPETGIEAGRWWLVTEDSGSTGHAVEVWINGTLVQSVTSGQPQIIFDLGPYLVRGTNTVTVRSNSVSPGGGTLYLYIGTGRNENGTVMMDTPEIQFGLGTSRNGPYERQYTLEIP